jgi:hypothetical protein
MVITPARRNQMLGLAILLIGFAFVVMPFENQRLDGFVDFVAFFVCLGGAIGSLVGQTFAGLLVGLLSFVALAGGMLMLGGFPC